MRSESRTDVFCDHVVAMRHIRVRVVRYLSESALTVFFGRLRAFAARLKERKRLPISGWLHPSATTAGHAIQRRVNFGRHILPPGISCACAVARSEEHTSELQS